MLFVSFVVKKSIHRQRLRQIPRKIRIKPAHHAHVIREQLQRQDGEQGVGLRVGRIAGDEDRFTGIESDCSHISIAEAKQHLQVELQF